MRGIPGEGWKIFPDGEEFENIPLWRALAQFTCDDLDDGLQENASVLSREKLVFQRYYNTAFVVSLIGGVLAFIFLLALLIAVRTSAEAEDALFIVVLVLLAVTATPHVWRHIYQYGVKTPDEPLSLPHAPDRHFDEFLSCLQKVSGPQAYYLSRFGKKRKSLDRRQFFGRLRYFLFSEHSADRRMVMRFRSGLAAPSDIFIHRDDLERMIALGRPKRKGGPGRNTKYAYTDAIISLIGHSELGELDLSDRAVTIRTIKKWLSQWFESHADESGDVPRGDLLTPYAEKICAHLDTIAAANGH